MEILKENYKNLEEKILSELESVKFEYSNTYDLELSGLCPTHETIYDTQEVRYSKCKLIAEKYRIIELGLVTFHKDKSSHSYIVRPYKIYVFPTQDFSNGKFNMEIGAIIFNREHGTNFNNWIYHGVPYVNNDQLSKMTDLLIERNINKYNPEKKKQYINLYKKEDIIKYNNFYEKFTSFYNDITTKEIEVEKIERHIITYFLNVISDDIRKHIYIDYYSSNSLMKIIKVTNEEKILLINKDNKRAREQIINAKGVKTLFEKIISKKKILVGHNCLFDLLFCMSHFMETLPQYYEVFRKKVYNSFGGIFDTKYLYKYLSNEEKTSSHLEGIYKELYSEYKDKINFTIPNNEKENFNNYLSDNEKEKFHQADYDAFVTGCLFVFLIEKYGKESVYKHNFKLNLMYSVYKGMNLNGEEELRVENV